MTGARLIPPGKSGHGQGPADLRREARQTTEGPDLSAENAPAMSSMGGAETRARARQLMEQLLNVLNY